MKSRSLLLLFTCILFTSCSENDNPVTPNDNGIQSQLIGTWNTGAYTIQFNADDTFMDSVSGYYGAAPVVQVLNFVVSGRYAINNGVIYFSNCHLVYADSTHWDPQNVGKGLIFYAAKPEFVGRKLTLTSTEPFTQTGGDGTKLKGNWVSDLWYVGVERWPAMAIREGIISTNYIFDSDSSKYQFVQMNSCNSPFYQNSGSYSYTYTPPHLNTVNNTNILVEFSQKTMLWTYDWGNLTYTKIK